MKTNIIKIVYPGEFSFTYVPNTFFSLDDVFHAWNAGSTQECDEFKHLRVRSMCSNDCVCVNGTWYQCMSVGWREVTKEFVDYLEQKVIEHPDYEEMRAWSCLNNIMWERKKKNSVMD